MYRIYRSGQLEYFQKKADKSFWEEHWEACNLEEELKKENQFIQRTLFQYNAHGSRVLEGGCGSCSFLYPMKYSGYQAVGVDFAEKTLQAVKKIAPELTLCIGDLTTLAFKDASFDAYWSIGVIEHFINGYEEILIECKRVLKDGGIAYISFPYMNFLRRLKGKLGCYKKMPLEDMEFYQYVLDQKLVKKKWEDYGFKFLDRFYMFPHFRHNFIKSRVIHFLTDPWHHHSVMLLFKKLR